MWREAKETHYNDVSLEVLEYYWYWRVPQNFAHSFIWEFILCTGQSWPGCLSLSGPEKYWFWRLNFNCDWWTGKLFQQPPSLFTGRQVYTRRAQNSGTFLFLWASFDFQSLSFGAVLFFLCVLCSDKTVWRHCSWTFLCCIPLSWLPSWRLQCDYRSALPDLACIC